MYLFGILNSLFFNIAQVRNIIEELYDEGVKTTIFGSCTEIKNEAHGSLIEHTFSNIQDVTKLKIGLIAGSMWILSCF